MPITVTHKFVSAIPDAGDPTIVQPSNWNDTHQLAGLGTMAEQNANAVAITGGTISGVTIPASNITGTLGVSNGGTGATTLTGYVYGNGTGAMTAATTIPNTSITGLGTASTKDAGAALGVATLDASGKVPVSELPAAVLGALSYQGTWDASTNTPTLTSSVGTKGYYYVVSVAGSTNLNGITDWLVGDWAVYNGTVWQKVDNTDAGGDVVGPASATDNAIARFDTTTGKLIQNSVVTVDDTGAVTGVTTLAASTASVVDLSVTGTLSFDAAQGTAGQVLTSAGTGATPTWTTPTTGTVTSVAATVPSFLSVAGSPITTSGTLALTYSGTALPLANGGTGQTTANTAFNALAPSQTSNTGKYLTTNGTDTSWATVSAATDLLENNQTITTNYTVTASKNALAVGPITINTGASVTVGTGQRWLILN